ncbi:hypothetical protein C6P40_000633 [Pichia californica]|uniref:Uncharacterized protein n=1 Tax=Pichia californica TaxID=460514 RepID=A0A9P7BI37_9ASCO|nr:hypothetical protein C6P42_001972 [[Candida] californica]KAG0690919.1 hypothetical protein C6P40_000633 [[Candida] californica]
MQTEELLKNILHWRAHLTVFLLQFLITSSIIYGFACAIKSTESSLISKWMLVGLIVTGCCPTTVSSNVVMTRKADGNVLLTLCEVFLGNIAGAFITPALVQMYFRGEWQFANPANGNSIGIVYKNVIKQVGISVFIPLIVGQVIQNLFPKKTKWFLSTFKINKVGSLMLLLLMFSSFSTAFYQHAFESVTNESIIFMIIFDIGIYLLFTVICFIMSRPYLMHKMFEKIPDESTSKIYNFFYHIIKPFYYNREDTISVLLCGGAKTAALGVTLISSQYGDNNEHLGELLVPLVLYQAIQVITAGFLTPFMKKWVHDGPQYKLKLQEEEETTRIRLQEEEVGLLANQSNEEIIPNQSENDLISSNKVNLKNTPQNYGSSSNT